MTRTSGVPVVGARHATQTLPARGRRRLSAVLYGLALCGLALVCAGLICAGATAGRALAGYEEGMDAFSRGDYATAFEELRPLADRGDPNAQFTLGFMYDYGQGVRRNAIEAIWWYRKAAEQGSAVAQFTLGGIYESGRGAPKDLIAAYRWYSLAAESLPAGEIRNTVMERQSTVAGQLSDSELTHARELLLGQAATADAASGSATTRRAGPDAPVDRDLLARIQTELARLGYHTGRADGVMNESTRGAILAFEIESGRDPSGTPTEALLDALVGVESTGTTLAAVEDTSSQGATLDTPPDAPLDTTGETSQTALADEDPGPVADSAPSEATADAVPNAEIAPATEDEAVARAPDAVPSGRGQEAALGTDDAGAATLPATAAERPSEADQLAALPSEAETAAVPLTGERPAAAPSEPEPQFDRDFVRAIQSELKRLGYDVGPIDGLAGRRTVTAVRAFEAAEHLPATGVLSEELLDQLRAAQPPQTQSADENAAFDLAGASETEEGRAAPEEADGSLAGDAPEEATAPRNAALPEDGTAPEDAAAPEDGPETGEFAEAAEGIAGPEAADEARPDIGEDDPPSLAGQTAPANDGPGVISETAESAAADTMEQTALEPASVTDGTERTTPISDEPFEAPALQIGPAEPQPSPSQPPVPASDRDAPDGETANGIEQVALQAPAPSVDQAQPADEQPAAEASALQAPTPLIPMAQSPTAPSPALSAPTTEATDATPSAPSANGPDAAGAATGGEAAQPQTAALAPETRPNEIRETEPGSTEPKPDPAAAAKRRVLNRQLARLGEIAAQVDSPSAAVPGWSKLEAWETETANVLSSRFGPRTANDLLAKRQELVLGDPFGNFKRTTQAYRLYLNGLKKDL